MTKFASAETLKIASEIACLPLQFRYYIIDVPGVRIIFTQCPTFTNKLIKVLRLSLSLENDTSYL